MADSPHDIQFSLAEFDRTQLPESQRNLQGDDFRQAVREHLAEQFAGHGGAAEVAITGDRVIIRWKESAETEPLAELGAGYLMEGDHEKGIAILRLALERDPEDAAALFNLGMGLGELGQTGEGLELLERRVEIAPHYPGAWVAHGVALARSGQWDAAIRSLREAVARNPQDAIARMNLGAALSKAGQLAAALDHLKAAVVLQPDDPQAWLNLALNLEQSGETREADTAYRRVMQLDSGGRSGELAELGRNRITGLGLRKVDGGFRPDVLAFCAEALCLFDRMPPDEVRRITMEIAMLGTKGLSVSDPAEKYTLRTLPGNFSGLRLLCIEYVGLKIIDPSVDLGLDITTEYEEACRLRGQG